MTKRQKIRFLLGLVVLIGGIFLIKNLKFGETLEEIIVEPTARSVKTIEFGRWAPDKKREILAVVESEQETQILSEVMGTVEEVFVEIGDLVQKGDLLASFQRIDDATQINFENAIRTLETTKISAENSIRSSEISLENAKRELQQTKMKEAQNHKKTFETLETTVRNADSTLSNGLNFVDRILGASSKFRYEFYTGRSEIGAKNTIKKNDTKNLVESLRREFDSLPEIPRGNTSDVQVLAFAESRKAFAKELQVALFWFDDLVRDSILSQNFSESSRQGVQTQAEAILAKIDGMALSLETQIESAKTIKENSRFVILSSENRVKNAEASVEMATSSSRSQISASQSQYLLAKSSQNDLNIRSPFSGKITEKKIQKNDRVLSNSSLFTLVNESASKKIIAFLSQEEWEAFKLLDSIDVRFSDDSVFTAKRTFLSSKLDPQSQKIRVEILIDNGAVSQKLLVGSFAQLLLPLGQDQKNLIPLSSVSFEPDGAEVLRVNNENKTERVKISYGKIISDAVNILDGVSVGDSLIEFYSRVGVGELVEVVNLEVQKLQ